MRGEISSESTPSAPDWSRVIFIAAACALGGIGFLAATLLMNGRTLAWFQRSAAAQVADIQLPAPAAEPVKALPKPKPPVNDRFQAIEIRPRSDIKSEINKAALARCRSHVAAGKPFETLSPKRIAAIREARGSMDPEAICVEHFAGEDR